jgi:hypothetical protein
VLFYRKAREESIIKYLQMDALLEYADPGSPPRQSEISLKMKINAAPDVSSNATKNSDVVVQDNELVYNPDAESLYSSQYGKYVHV